MFHIVPLIVGFATAQQHRHTKRNKVLALWCATWQFAWMCSQILNTAIKLSLPGRSSESAFKAWKSLLLKACRLLDFEGASYLTHGDDLRIGYLYLGMPWMPQQISETIDHHGYLPETSSLSKHQNHRPSTYLFKLSLHWTIATLANLLLYNAIYIYMIYSCWTATQHVDYWMRHIERHTMTMCLTHWLTNDWHTDCQTSR